MTDVIITNGTSLRVLIQDTINEGVKSALYKKGLREKEKQSAVTGSTSDAGAPSPPEGGGTDLFSGGSTDGDVGANDKTQAAPSKTMDDETEKLKQGDIDVDDITDKLNSIRSGKSFKDDKVGAAMASYVQSLSKAERVALLAFLKGIAQIVTGEVAAQAAEEPSNAAPDVKMQKGSGGKKVRHVKPNVIKGQRPKAAKDQNGAEDTSAPVAAPIKPVAK